MAPSVNAARQRIGRYLVCDEIAAGGMATVHLGRVCGPAGFSRTVAIKRLHPQFAKEPEFVSMFVDEARLAARVHHPNVVPVVDVIADGGELLLVMEYVHGVSLSELLRVVSRTKDAVAAPIAVAIAVGILRGLDAAHAARDERGAPLGIVHRDVSPQNVLVGADGVPRLVDFGVAKAAGRIQTTREGQIKGKSAYMAPEQVRGLDVDARADLFAASVVLWEMLVGDRLFVGDNGIGVLAAVLEKRIEAPSRARAGAPPELDDVVLRGLSRDPRERFATARAMEEALLSHMTPAPARDVAAWVQEWAGPKLADRAALMEKVEREPIDPEASASSLGAAVVSRAPASFASRAAYIGAGVLVAGVAAFALARNASRATANPPAPPSPSLVASVTVPDDHAPAVTASPPQTGTVPPSATTPPAKRRRTPAAHDHARTTSCDPPYTLDPTGIRIPKPQCL